MANTFLYGVCLPCGGASGTWRSAFSHIHCTYICTLGSSFYIACLRPRFLTCLHLWCACLQRGGQLRAEIIAHARLLTAMDIHPLKVCDKKQSRAYLCVPAPVPVCAETETYCDNSAKNQRSVKPNGWQIVWKGAKVRLTAMLVVWYFDTCHCGSNAADTMGSLALATIIAPQRPCRCRPCCVWPSHEPEYTTSGTT